MEEKEMVVMTKEEYDKMIAKQTQLKERIKALCKLYINAFYGTHGVLDLSCRLGNAELRLKSAREAEVEYFKDRRQLTALLQSARKAEDEYIKDRKQLKALLRLIVQLRNTSEKQGQYNLLNKLPNDYFIGYSACCTRIQEQIANYLFKGEEIWNDRLDSETEE